MRTNLVNISAVLACAAIPALAYETDKPVQVNTDGIQSNVAAQVQQRADESLKSLMEYLWFTRKIHGLWIEDVTRARPDAVAANEPKFENRQMATRTTGQR